MVNGNCLSRRNMRLATALVRMGGLEPELRPRNRPGSSITTVDGMWIIALGMNGVVGLISYESALFLPMVILIRRYPIRTWRTQTLHPEGHSARDAGHSLFNRRYCECDGQSDLLPCYSEE